jgi:hypothetical protein
MALYTDPISFANYDLFYSTDGSAWTEKSGEAGTIEMDGFEAAQGTFYTGEGPVVARGANGAGTITVTAGYSETAGSLFRVAEAAYVNKTPLYFRWAPKGATTGNRRYTTSSGVVTNQPMPVGDPESGDVVTTPIALYVGSVTSDAVP